MSSPSEDNHTSPSLEDEQIPKKRRVRACDQCRRRKVKCDGGEDQGRKCSNCVSFKYECTYLAGTDKRFCDVDYVRNLENEVSDLKQLIRRLQLELATRISAGSSINGTSSTGLSRVETPKAPMSICLTPGVEESLNDEGEDDDQEGLVLGFKSLNVDAPHSHFLGRSSTLMLIRTALDMKQEFAGGDKATETETPQGRAMPSRRPEFWDAIDMLNQPEPPYTDFPEPLLMGELIEDFFLNLNVNFPLLHRPTFEKRIKSGLHLREEAFGATLLLVCAVASRFSHNPAVLMEGSRNWHWAGWRWFSQVRERRKLIPMRVTTVFDVQVTCLSAAYVAASAAPHSTYAIVGHGLRLAQDLGAHRRMAYGPLPTVQDEEKKRVFWCLLAMDRGMCSLLGRPCTFHDEDIDIDYPIECDDEYWETEDPAMAFKQPPGKPSTVAFFNCTLRLNKIHAYALRTIYSLKRSKFMTQPDKAQETVSDIDSRLNSFIDSIPDHLKWDPHQPNLLFASQSAILHSWYYSTQIVVHRPFIPTPRKPSPLTFPSLAICTNAARSCIHVLDRQFQRIGEALFHHWHQMPLFASAIVLLLNIWSSRKLGSSVDTAKEMEEIGKVLRMLAVLESRWNTAGRFADILRDLASGAGVDIFKEYPHPQKRRRDDAEDHHPVPGPSTTTSPEMDTTQPRNFAGSRRAEQYQQSVFSTESVFTSAPLDADFDFTLPVHSEDLGRIPVASGFDQAPGGWQGGAFAGAAAAHASMGAGMPAQTAGDASFDALFAGLLPDGEFDNTFAAFGQGGGPFGGQGFGMGPMPAGNGMQGLSSFGGPSHGGGQPAFSQGAGGSWQAARDGASWDMGGYMMNMHDLPRDGGFPP